MKRKNFPNRKDQRRDDANARAEKYKKPKNPNTLREQVKQGIIHAADALSYLDELESNGAFIQPNIVRWLKRRIQLETQYANRSKVPEQSSSNTRA